MIRTLIAASLLLTASSSQVFAYCFEPSPPSCATQYGEFSDQFDFDNCKRSMNYYASEVDTYASCRHDEAAKAMQDAQRDADNAIDEFNDAVGDFNERAGG